MKDILSYESDIWSCADLLISTGIKQSDFPKHMMPFFALVMLEGRMRNEMTDIEQTEGLNREDNPEEFVEAFKDRGCGYNEYTLSRMARRCLTSATMIRPLKMTSATILPVLMEN